jgi:predicted RecB family nuclease
MTETRHPATTSPVRRGLGGGDIGRCLTRIHHDRFTQAVEIDDPVRQRAIARGRAFEDDIVARLLATSPDAVDISSHRWEDRSNATLAAMDSGVGLVLGSRLENDDGTLVGMPDILIRDVAGYLAIDVKNHKVIGGGGLCAVRAPLDDLLNMSDDTVRFRSYRRRDLLQVTHYRFLLKETGHASPRTLGGIIGTDEPLGCTWVDLTQGEPTLLEEHVAYIATARSAIEHGISHPGSPLVDPWFRGECNTCIWHALCVGALTADDDPTLLRDVSSDTRSALRDLGITTIADVAGLDPESGVVDGGVVFQARARAAAAVLRSDAGRGSLPLPSAPLEVDLDIETYDGRTYLAGLLLTDANGSRYDPIAEWSGSEEGERTVLERLFSRLAAWSVPDTVVFHWTDYEVRRLSAGAERYGLSIDGWATVEEWFDANAVDLCDWTRRHLVSPKGHSLKMIAPLCGFQWRDDDPGGLQSEIWFEELIAGNEAMRDRLLEYNEDDVVAQLRVREFIRSEDNGNGPGSSIPSVRHRPIPSAG